MGVWASGRESAIAIDPLFSSFRRGREKIDNGQLQCVVKSLRDGVSPLQRASVTVLVMPIWLETVGFGGAPPFPNLGAGTLLSTLGHIVYAVLLGLLYAFHRS